MFERLGNVVAWVGFTAGVASIFLVAWLSVVKGGANLRGVPTLTDYERNFDTCLSNERSQHQYEQLGRKGKSMLDYLLDSDCEPKVRGWEYDKGLSLLQVTLIVWISGAILSYLLFGSMRLLPWKPLPKKEA